MLYPKSINDFFTLGSVGSDGAIPILREDQNFRDRLYLHNGNGRKLLQLIVKNEADENDAGCFAQIKLIPYGVRRAYIYNDRPSDPQVEMIQKGMEMTYHGGPRNGSAAKLHLKAKNIYKTLVDCCLELSHETPHHVPLFTFESGYDWNKPLLDNSRRKAHVLSANCLDAVRFDFYLASCNVDFDAFVNSMYFFNLLWTPDYLIRERNCPLESGRVIAPMMIFKMKEYSLLVRRSLSRHKGRPFLRFYNNANYYEKMMNRRIGWRNAMGQMQWSTVADEEKRMLEPRS